MVLGHGGDWRGFLEKNGVDVIAIPCNTSHYFWQDMQNMDNIICPIFIITWHRSMCIS